jgi:hypothetical protein
MCALKGPREVRSAFLGPYLEGIARAVGGKSLPTKTPIKKYDLPPDSYGIN